MEALQPIAMEAHSPLPLSINKPRMLPEGEKKEYQEYASPRRNRVDEPDDLEQLEL